MNVIMINDFMTRLINGMISHESFIGVVPNQVDKNSTQRDSMSPLNIILPSRSVKTLYMHFT